MTANRLRLLVCLLIAIVSMPLDVGALDQTEQREFNRLAELQLVDLAHETQTLLNEKYPNTDWRAHKIPHYARKDDAVLVAYKIAAIEPELLLIDGCYCLCEAVGHESLKDCFIEKTPGWFGGRYSDHGASCDICVTQAMLTFLWTSLGATDEEIVTGTEKKFSWIVEKYGTQ